MTPELITGRTYRVNEKTKRLEVVYEYGYMAAETTLTDAELIARANERERELKARRA